MASSCGETLAGPEAVDGRIRSRSGWIRTPSSEGPALSPSPPVSFVPPPPDDPATWEALPGALRGVLAAENGFVRLEGGLHVRGVCREPAWHSLGRVWTGAWALVRRFPGVEREDVPFAQSGLGEQFLLRDHDVWRLDPASGVLEPAGVSLGNFFRATSFEATAFLRLEPLRRFQATGGSLAPGEILRLRQGEAPRPVPVAEWLGGPA